MTQEDNGSETLNIMAASVGMSGFLGFMEKAIEANTPLLASNSRTLFVWKDGLDVQVYQGENTDASSNMMLGNVRIDGTPFGKSEIEMTFAVDVNGLLSITVHNKTMRKKHRVTITTSLALSKADVELEALFVRSFTSAHLDELAA